MKKINWKTVGDSIREAKEILDVAYEFAVDDEDIEAAMKEITDAVRILKDLNNLYEASYKNLS